MSKLFNDISCISCYQKFSYQIHNFQDRYLIEIIKSSNLTCIKDGSHEFVIKINENAQDCQRKNENYCENESNSDTEGKF